MSQPLRVRVYFSQEITPRIANNAHASSLHPPCLISQFLTQRLAQEVDVQLMGPKHGFSIDQLMELAGLAVAYAVAYEYPPALFGRGSAHAGAGKRVGIVCGPGSACEHACGRRSNKSALF